MSLEKIYAVQIKRWCWVAHLFTIALMELSVMHLAGDLQSITFATTIIGINACWQGLFS